MSVDISLVEAAAHEAIEQGIGMARNAYDPSILAPVAISEFSHRPGWEGVDARVEMYDDVYDFPDSVQQVFEAVQKGAVGAGFQDWAPNYVMLRTTTDGTNWHKDKSSFRHLSFFLGVQGLTHFYDRDEGGKPRGKLILPGDILAMRQFLHPLDTDTGRQHAVGKTGLRTVVMVGHVRHPISHYKIEQF